MDSGAKYFAGLVGIGVTAYLFFAWMDSASDAPQPAGTSAPPAAQQPETDVDLFDGARSEVDEGTTDWRDLVREPGSDEPATVVWPDGGTGWDEAWRQAGDIVRVCGPLMSMRETVDGTFLNVGRDYPDPDRFVFIFWDATLDPISSGTTVCGTGEVYIYEDGSTQMALFDSVEVWE